MAQGVAVSDIGLRLEYGDELNAGELVGLASSTECGVSTPRLSARIGMLRLLASDPDGAVDCLSDGRIQAPDALILLASAYHLSQRASDAWATFQRLPAFAQSLTPLAALMVFDAAPPGSDAAPVGNILPRRILFYLMDSRPDVAERFLEKAIQGGLLFPEDRSDFVSFLSWQGRANSIASSTPKVAFEDTLHLSQAVASAIGCAGNAVSLGPDLLPSGTFARQQDLDAWRVLGWTSGAETFNQGAFKLGLDMPTGSQNGVALRISGLWKTDNPHLYPASGSLELTGLLPLSKGKNPYVMSVRYKTENARAGTTDIWFDSADYRRFVGVWRLPSTDGAWQELYALGYIDGDVTPTVHPMISHSALGTVWIDYLKVMTVHLNGCIVNESIRVVGESF